MAVSFHARDNRFTHVCGHRGFSLYYPENTLLALEETRKAGGTTCEIDILLTRDEEVILLHDETLDRTTNGHGYAADHSWAEISRLDAGLKTSAEFAGARIPTFRETVEWAKANDIGIEAELKDYERADLLARRVIEILEETDGFGNVMLISFDHKELLRIRERDERVRVEPITHAKHANLLQVVRSCRAESVSIELAMFDPEDARRLHEEGFCNRVHCPRPAKLAAGWKHGRDPLPTIIDWLQGGLIDSISGDDVTFLRKLVDRAPIRAERLHSIGVSSH